MIAGIFHAGSGLGNQLHRYVFTRVRAKDMGVPFGMANPRDFKGYSFMNIDIGIGLHDIQHEFIENRVDADGIDVRPYDPRVREIKNDTVVDGEFQDEKYFMHRIDEVREWLKTDPMIFDDNACILAFRGGEYTLYSDLFLTKKYWTDAMENMRKFNPMVHFQVVTDDIITAKEFFPDLLVTHEIGDDWRAIRYAPYLILSNSSFGILPAILNENARKIIAPLHWARHNLGVWAMPQNCYTKFTYQDREGNLYE